MTTTASDFVISDVARQYLRLSLATEVGPIRARRLFEHFGTLEAVFSSSRVELERVEGVGSRVAESILRAGRDDLVDREIDGAAASGVRIFCWEDEDYPRPLLNITDPPICLYVRGRFEPTDAVAVSVVGTRRCSHYGREQAIRFGELLGRAGLTVVSGLALGIDSDAHRGALRAGGRTLAVLGNGLPEIYPSQHEVLANEIASAGAILSECPMHTKPDRSNFPRRNRIIAGLSLGVVVIEAGPRSGALITARLASEYNREVFALPGRVDQPHLTQGVHRLIRDGGAKLITCLEDILDELGDVGQIMGQSARSSRETSPNEDAERAPQTITLPSNEQAVLDALDQGCDEVDAVCSAAQLETAKVTTALTSLELKGLVLRQPGNRFVRRSRK